MAAFNAAGDYMHPHIVFPVVRMTNINRDGFPGATYGSTKTGWMVQDEFLAWITIFNNYIDEMQIQKPVLLFVDGHVSHVGLDASEFARTNQIILYCLVANATNIMQPCDLGFFAQVNIT